MLKLSVLCVQGTERIERMRICMKTNRLRTSKVRKPLNLQIAAVCGQQNLDHASCVTFLRNGGADSINYNGLNLRTECNMGLSSEG